LIPRNSSSLLARLMIISLLAVFAFYGCSSKDKQDKEEEKIEVNDPLPENQNNLLELASVQMSDWKGEEGKIISDAEEISGYMDKDTELYLSYGFKKLAVKEYKNGKSLPMLVEICEFNNSANAYGIYSFNTVGDKPGIGQGSVYDHGVLKFWKGNMLVRVVAREDYLDLEEDVLEFGRKIDAKILSNGEKPELQALMPEENLVPDSLHFFHKNICLNNICYIPESVDLGLSEQTNAFTARYAFANNGQAALLLLVEYPDKALARTGFDKFSASYFRAEQSILAERPINTIRVTENEYNSISLKDNFLIMVLEAQNADICKKLVAATLAKIDLYYKS